MPRYVNKAELSELLEVSERSFTDWQKEGMPIHQAAEVRGQENSYQVGTVVRWWIQRELAKAQVRSPRDRLDDVRAEREGLLLKQLRRELVDHKELRPLLERFVQDNIAKLEAMPEKYAALLHQVPDLDGKHQLLRQIVREIREGLGDYEFCCETTAGGDEGL